MPAGEVSALLQLEANSVAFHFLIHIFSESRKKKIGTLLELVWVGGVPDWFPACRRGWGPGSRNHHGGRNRAQIASCQPSAWLQSQLESTRGQRERGAWPSATHGTVHSEMEGSYASHSMGLLPASLRTRAAGGGVGVLCPQRCVWTWSAACRISSLATGSWEWLRGHSFLVAFLGDHPDCRVFWPLVNIDSLF